MSDSDEERAPRVLGEAGEHLEAPHDAASRRASQELPPRARGLDQGWL